jgi:aminoglycoside 6'-N-acetyltransferase I
MSADDRAAVHAMMHALWPDFDGDEGGEQVLVFETDAGAIGGFVSFGERKYGEGCDTSPVGWVEGWWVAPELRRAGVGRALIAGVEAWARDAGYTELGSDTWLDNTGSIDAHRSIGFELTERLQFFRKRLR